MEMEQYSLSNYPIKECDAKSPEIEKEEVGGIMLSPNYPKSVKIF